MRSAVRAQRVVSTLLPRHPDALALSFVFMLLPLVCYLAQRCASVLGETAFSSYFTFVLHELRLYTVVAPFVAVVFWVLHTCLPQRQIVPPYLQADFNKIVGFQFVQWVVVEYLFNVFGWTTPYYFQVLHQVAAPVTVLGKIHALATMCAWGFYYVNIFPYHFIVTLVWNHWSTVFPIVVTLLRWLLPVAACLAWGFRHRHRQAVRGAVLMSVGWACCEMLGYLHVVNLAEVTARIVDVSVAHASLGWMLMGWMLMVARVVGLVGTAAYFSCQLHRLPPGALLDTAQPIDRKQLDVMNGVWAALLPLVGMVGLELGVCYITSCPSLTSVLVRPLCAVVTQVAPGMVATEMVLQGAAALWQAAASTCKHKPQLELGSSLEFWVCSAGLVILTVLSSCLGWAPTALHYGMSSVWFALWLDL